MSEANRPELREVAESEKEGAGVEIDLLELFYRLLEKARNMAAAALIGALVMAIYSFGFARPVYEATSRLYVISSSDSAINLSDLQIGSYLTSDYQEVFDTWEVQEKVLQNLGLDYTYEQLSGKINVKNPGNTRILDITASSQDPVEATALANEFARVAKEYISQTMKTDEPSLLSQALQPTKPVSPHKTRNVVLGFLLGALVAVVVIVFRFMLDDKIKTAEDIRRYTGMSTLAVVPVNDGGNAAYDDYGFGESGGDRA